MSVISEQNLFIHDYCCLILSFNIRQNNSMEHKYIKLNKTNFYLVITKNRSIRFSAVVVAALVYSLLQGIAHHYVV